ncbi:MmgE/PrpD family protein [Bordetella sp. 15P40C-2]|uniref:MmgE/PrpD family protein n=1 Tax=Bordetella sp. 15P40C-2 TaxID=2572246 RepID=UPI001365E7E5|nr:MmgE/PrpD family protein [Bordetella sp. 15P40C-2]
MTKETDVIAHALTRFCNQLDLDAVPQAVRDRSCDLMLDAIGCALAARQEAFAKRYSHVVFSPVFSAGSERGVIGFSQRAALRDAALLNGILAHGLDFDDTHMAGIAHLSVSVMPTVLALGAQLNADGRAVLRAYITGVECGARLASVVKGRFTTKGFHPSAVVGTFASTMAASSLMRLDQEQTLCAQGFALSMAAGTLQFLEDGAWTKRMHPGWAAQSAITAALMGSDRIPAPQAPYLGRYGLYSTHLDAADLPDIDIDIALRGLPIGADSANWELMNVAVKPYPMCHFVHASVEAAIKLHREGVNPDDIERVTVSVPAGTVQSVCEPLDTKRRPSTDYEAKFSTPYAVASGLIRGRLGLQDLEPEAFTSDNVRRLMAKTDYVVDTDSTFPKHYSGQVSLRMRDGQVRHQSVPVNPGHAERPLDRAQVLEKFMANGTRYFSKSHAELICDRVTHLERLPAIRELETLLAQDPD